MNGFQIGLYKTHAHCVLPFCTINNVAILAQDSKTIKIEVLLTKKEFLLIIDLINNYGRGTSAL